MNAGDVVRILGLYCVISIAGVHGPVYSREREQGWLQRTLDTSRTAACIYYIRIGLYFIDHGERRGTRSWEFF